MLYASSTKFLGKNFFFKLFPFFWVHLKLSHTIYAAILNAPLPIHQR